MKMFSGILRDPISFVIVACIMSIPCSAQSYKILDRYKLHGASVGGIAVDSAARRLYVAVDDGVAILNLDTGVEIGSVPLAHAEDVLLLPHGAGESDMAPIMGFASGQGGFVAFTLADLKPTLVQHLATGGVTTMCFDDEAQSIVAVSSEGSVASFDSKTGKLQHQAKLETGAGQIACGVLHQVYVADPKHNVVHVLNHVTDRNDGDIPMLDGIGPTGLALDTRGRRLFVSCENRVIEIIDTDAGFIFTQLPGGEGRSQARFVWTPQGKGQWKAGAFIAQQDGTLIGVRMNAFINYTIGGDYKLPAGLAGIAYDSKTHHLFLSAESSGTSSVIVAGY